MCIMCPATSFFGSLLANFMGIHAPQDPQLKLISAVASTSLTLVTVIALKCLFHVSLCDGSALFTPRNIAQVASLSFLVGLIYTVAVNYILSRQTEKILIQPKEKRCCHSK